MDPRHLFVDKRLVGSCVYCGAQADTRDHVPARIFLDDPLPGDLPVVDACRACNSKFSVDEEYLACFLECVLAGSVDPERVSREKIRRVIKRKPKLAERIEACRRIDQDGTIMWMPEQERVRNVVIKLAQGHAAFELSQAGLEADRVWFVPLVSMAEADRRAFEKQFLDVAAFHGWPDVGSRAFLRACGAAPYTEQPGPWMIVEEGRYRYCVEDGGAVQIVLSEYLACVVDWR